MGKKDTRKRYRMTFDKRLTDKVRSKMQREDMDNELFNLVLRQKKHWLDLFFSGTMNTISRSNYNKGIEFLQKKNK